MGNKPSCHVHRARAISANEGLVQGLCLALTVDAAFTGDMAEGHFFLRVSDLQAGCPVCTLSCAPPALLGAGCAVAPVSLVSVALHRRPGLLLTAPGIETFDCPECVERSLQVAVPGYDTCVDSLMLSGFLTPAQPAVLLTSLTPTQREKHFTPQLHHHHPATPSATLVSLSLLAERLEDPRCLSPSWESLGTSRRPCG